MRRSKTLLAILALVALAGACGGGDDADTAGSGSDTTAENATTDTAAVPDDPTDTTGAGSARTGAAVTIAKTSFSPSEVAVKKGAAVVWNFADGGVEHTVTADDGSFDSKAKKAGTFEHTFTEAGTVAYHCEIHPFMKGSVTVTD